MLYLLATLVGYLIGSFPSGIVISRFYGVDPRTVGSGRTGGTNVYRAAGPVAGIATALADLLKGAVAILVVRALIVDAPLADALTGLAAVAGHNWSLYLRFKGGAGTMTNAGTVFFLWWPAVVVVGGLAVLSLLIWRMSSLASILFSLGLPIAFGLGAAQGWVPWQLLLFAVGQALLILWSLRPNIQRLLAGTERRLGQAREP